VSLTPGEGKVLGKGPWPVDLPTDSHLLAYLFCVYLAHPGWCFTKSLHQAAQPTPPSPSASSALPSPCPCPAPLGPLFVGSTLPASLGTSLAPSRKLLAVVESLSGLANADVDVLVISQACPAVFRVVWDRTLQFCSQVRYCTVLHCIVLYSTVLYCAYWTVHYCMVCS